MRLFPRPFKETFHGQIFLHKGKAFRRIARKATLIGSYDQSKEKLEFSDIQMLEKVIPFREPFPPDTVVQIVHPDLD